jgi:uncharacterized protein (TIGR02466 family)
MAELKEIRLFYNSIFTITLDPEIDIVSIVKDLESSGDSKPPASNSGGWQSGKKNYNSIEEIQPFLDVVTLATEKIYEQYDVAKKAVLAEYWFNINRYKDFNWAHNHPHSYFSAVFYIKVPPESGSIIFDRPDPFNDWIKTKSINEKNAPSLNVDPHTNMLLIFPSYFTHKVVQNLTNEERITMAFNYR